jgi:hypothetical protein
MLSGGSHGYGQQGRVRGAATATDVSIDIFSDKGELIESAHQDDVNIRDLPLLEHARE